MPQHRSAEAYTLNSAANESIPKEIRDQFPQDDNGHVLFFTTPPLNNRNPVVSSDQKVNSTPLKHSEAYTKSLTVRKRKLDQHQSQLNGDVDSVNLSTHNENGLPRPAKSPRLEAQRTRIVPDSSVGYGLTALATQVKKATYNEYQSRYGDEWKRILRADLDYGERQRNAETKADLAAEEKKEAFKTAHLGKYNGQFGLNRQGYISGWQKNFFTGVYLDDIDSRLP